MGLKEVLDRLGMEHAAHLVQQRRDRAKKRQEKLAKALKAMQHQQEIQRKLQETARINLELDKIVDLKTQMGKARDLLNANRPPNSQPWELIRISPTKRYRGFPHPDKVSRHEDLRSFNGFPQGSDGYALVRRLVRVRDGIHRRERYSYIFVGRDFKAFRLGRTLLPDIDDKNVGKYEVRAGESARFYNTDHTVSSRRGMKRDIWDNSPVTLSSYGSIFEPSNIVIGQKSDIVSHLNDPSWRNTARETFNSGLGAIIKRVDAHNKFRGRRALL